MHFSAKISRNLFLYKDLTFISKMSIPMNFSIFRFRWMSKYRQAYEKSYTYTFYTRRKNKKS